MAVCGRPTASLPDFLVWLCPKREFMPHFSATPSVRPSPCLSVPVRHYACTVYAHKRTGSDTLGIVRDVSLGGPRQDFAAGYGRADVLLDTPVYSGQNTALEARSSRLLARLRARAPGPIAALSRTWAGWCTPMHRAGAPAGDGRTEGRTGPA